MHLAMFLKSSSTTWCLASLDRVHPSGVPRRHRHYQGTKTSCAEYGLAYGFARPPHRPPLSFAPAQRRRSARAWPRSLARCRQLPQWSITGSPRFLGNPSNAFAPLFDPGRSDWPCLGGQYGAVPAKTNTRTPAVNAFRDSITRLQHPLPTLPQVCYRPWARLASGWWLTSTGRESNPLDSDERFPFPLPPFPGLP